MKNTPRVKVEVNRERIETAIRRDSGHCMIADSLAVARPNAKYISVDLATIRFTDLLAGQRYIYLTPRRAQLAIIAFDQGEPVEPFEITLEGPHVLATGNGRKGRRATLTVSETGTTMRRTDGKAPPLGPLVGGSPTRRRSSRAENVAGGSGNRTGRRREYGLRALIR